MALRQCDLARARRLAALERDFDAQPGTRRTRSDLIEEVGRLRGRLKAAGWRGLMACTNPKFSFP